MSKYSINEQNGIATLIGPNDKALISFEESSKCSLIVTYFNTNIERQGFGIGCAKSFGEEFQITISCKSEEDMKLCKTRYMELVTNGFTSELREYIGMDWGDLESVCYPECSGIHIHKTVPSEEWETIIKALIENVNKKYGKDFSAIACVDGDISFFEFIKSTELINANKLVVQYLLNANARDVMIDIWIFSK